MYIAAAATDIGERPGTMSNSTAFRAICVAALCTIFGSPRLEQNLDIKSPVVIRSTEVSSAFNINLKHLPISLLLILLTAHISLKVRGTPSWRHAIYKHAEAMASFDRPENVRRRNKLNNTYTNLCRIMIFEKLRTKTEKCIN